MNKAQKFQIKNLFPGIQKTFCAIQLLFLFTFHSAQAQIYTFTKLIGGPGTSDNYTATSICQTHDNGYIVGGYNGSGGLIPILLKLEADGSIQWMKEYLPPGAMNVNTRDVIQTADNGFLLVGETVPPTSNSEVVVFKTDSLGNMLWFKTYGDTLEDYGKRVFEIAPGRYLILGSVLGIVNLDAKPAVLTLDTSGNILTEKYMDVVDCAVPVYSGVLLKNNQIGILGSANLFIVADSTGQYLKDNDNYIPFTYGSVDALLADDGTYMVLSPVNNYTMLTKLDTATMSIIWQKKYLTSEEDIPTSLVQTNNNGFAIFGLHQHTGTSSGWFSVIRTDSTGVYLGTNYYTPVSAAPYYPGKMIKTYDGGYMMTGMVHMNTFNDQIVLVKTDANFQSGCNGVHSEFFASGSDTATMYFGPDSAFTYSLPNSGTAVTVIESIADTTVFDFCFQVGVENKVKKEAAKVFPNPSTSYIELSLDNPETLELIISDMTMRELLRKRVTGKEKIPVSFLTNGAYMVSVSDKNHCIFKQKIIKAGTP